MLRERIDRTMARKSATKATREPKTGRTIPRSKGKQVQTFQSLEGSPSGGVSLSPDRQGSEPTAQQINESLVIDSLREILLDDTASTAAKASAARTLAEINGQIGRHSTVGDTDSKPLSELTIDELEQRLNG